MVRVLKAPYLATVCLQRQNCSLSDFFGLMVGIDLNLKRKIARNSDKSGLAKLLIEKIDERKKILLENRLMITALYLDPRYKCELKNEPNKIAMAKLTLEGLCNRINEIRKLDELDHETSTNLDQQNISVISDVSDSMENCTLEAMLASVDQHYEGNLLDSFSEQNSHSRTTNSEISLAMDAYDEATINKRINSKENVMHFWEQNKDVYGMELYELACIVHAIPPTQSAVERLFSSLNFIFSDRRGSIKQDLLEEILLIHSNSGFLYEVQTEELDALKKNL